MRLIVNNHINLILLWKFRKFIMLCAKYRRSSGNTDMSMVFSSSFLFQVNLSRRLCLFLTATYLLIFLINVQLKQVQK